MKLRSSFFVRALLSSLVLFGAASWIAPAAAQESVSRSQPWSDRARELFGSLPVQEGGRVKPLSTFADFTLLRLNGKRSAQTSAGEKLDATAWLLDLAFFPDDAHRAPVFLVSDSDAVAALGISVESKRKRDRWSLDELEPGLEKLFALAHDYSQIEEKNRSSVQQQLVLLATNVHSLLEIESSFDFARTALPVPASDEVARVFGGRSSVDFHEIVAHGAELNALYQRVATQDGAQRELQALNTLERGAATLSGGREGPAFLPPVEFAQAEPEWLTSTDVLARALGEGRVAPEHVEMLSRVETMMRSRADAPAFEQELAALADTSRRLAHARGEDAKLDLERAYYRAEPLTWSLTAFIAAFLAVAIGWLAPKQRWIGRLAWFGVALGAMALVTAIAMRCAIRGRPPVSTLYETVLFVVAVGVLLALALERITRARIALSVAAALGMVGLFVANGYETLDKRDTMPSLVAVLDTNFWLATHVTAITIGYAAGVLAALLASVYLVTAFVRGVRADREKQRALAKMVYGVICFGVIFTTVGTILGGIWANESWGRFWGWDPKENGALLIVISQIALLHARLAGWLREHGTCVAAAFGGTVVAFSWWGVNLLGVGLHSYGFTSGIHTVLWSYYGVQWGVVGLGGIAWWRARSRCKRESVSAASAAEASAPVSRAA